MFPSQVAACKRAARTKNDVSKGNEFADKTAKAAPGPFESIATIQKVPQPIDHTILKDMHPHAPVRKTLLEKQSY